MEVGLARCERLELGAVINIALVAGAIDEPDLLAVAAVALFAGKSHCRYCQVVLEAGDARIVGASRSWIASALRYDSIAVGTAVLL